MKDRIRQEFKSMSPVQRAAELISLAVVVCGIICAIYMETVGRSLWWDEAALAWSFSQRPLAKLTSEGLEMIQAAPAGWLWMMKIVTLIFGNTDLVLRIPSVIAYVAVLIMTWRISREVLKLAFPMAVTAYTASFPLFLQYSNIFKPYMMDAFFSLLLVWIFWRYAADMDEAAVKATGTSGKGPFGRAGIAPWLRTGFMMAVIVWFSNPSCFVMAGMLVSFGLFALLHREWKKLLELILMCLLLGASFLIDYACWLSKTSGGMNTYWRDWFFPLIPTSSADLADIARMLGALFYPFYRIRHLALAVFLLAFVAVLIRRDRLVLGIYLAGLVTLFASWIRFYPVNKRLWLFYYPLVILCLFYAADLLLRKCSSAEPVLIRRGVSVTVMAGLLLAVLQNGGIRYYMQEKNIWWDGYEVKGEYAYLTSVAEEGDRIFVYGAQRPIFCYYNGYDMEHLRGTEIPVLVGDRGMYDPPATAAEYDWILSGGPCYLVMGDGWREPAGQEFLRYLGERGTVTRAYCEHDTPLYLYTP